VLLVVYTIITVKPAEKWSELTTKGIEYVGAINQGLAILKQLEGFAEIDPAEMNRVMKAYPILKKELTSINRELQKSQQAVAELTAQLQKPDPISLPPPETFEDCTQQIEVYVEAIAIRDTHITQLEAINTQQGITIQLQASIIEKQDQHIQSFREAQKATMRAANTRAFIGFAAGIIVTLIL